MKEFISSEIFSLTLTAVTFALASVLYKRTRFFLLNPVLTSVAALICILTVLDLDYETYSKGGRYISVFLAPAVVALALPLYHQRDLVRRYGWSLLIAISCGLSAGVAAASVIAVMGGCDRQIVISLAPKSVTTPIAMAISTKIGGLESLTAAFVVITGILGAAIGPAFLKKIGVTSKTAFGVAMGTAAHGIGTARANEAGETEGGFSGLSLCLAGIITAILLPLFLKLFL
jgi:predicted murein hydrolase (TIGR00659 family)